MDTIVGHERNLRYFKRVLERGALAHAYLFHGPDGVGKRTIALAIARSLLCRATTSPTLGGCGACDDCSNTSELTHPDLIYLSRDQALVSDETKRDIGIKNVHELQRRLAGTAWRGRWRVAVIDGAEDLSRDAQSALLKLLEEPRPRVVLVLLTSTPGALFETVRSRLVPIRFAALGDDVLVPFLAEVRESNRAELLRLAAGRPGVLVCLRDTKKLLTAARNNQRTFAKLLDADLPAQFAFASEEHEPDELTSFFEFLVSRLREGFHRELVAGNLATRTSDIITTILKTYELLEGTAVNRRLLTASAFFELSALAGEGGLRS